MMIREAITGGLYRDKKGIIIAFKPILHSNFMAPARW
jgi:hypothetical protein